ncbi:MULTISPECIES: PadR family transcriptional regulator [Nocardia]|uniref:PadR family transcriptional regulator n=1 Tax=Nocardia TaxID=1817 RepID=UPI002453B9B0|nr:MULTISPECIES: helix-turn-helix transcriptional regulator [Nocardia]
MSWNPFRARRERGRLRIAAVLLAFPDDEHYGYSLSRRAQVSSGVLYPVLARMRRDGWLTDGWQPVVEGQRYRRRWYRLTDTGRHELANLLIKAGRS